MYLATVLVEMCKATAAAGTLPVADEIMIGWGRTETEFWKQLCIQDLKGA